jgi:hypothetical protein
MNKVLTFALAMVVCLGTTALLATRSQTSAGGQKSDAILDADGAFRDGIYMGRLTAERGRPAHPMTGRWASDKDRASFAAGYNRGYNDSLATATANEKSTRSE